MSDNLFLNDVAIKLRHIADSDYLASRSCYKYGCILQSYWFAQQAIEKYFKSILLFNQKKFKHLKNGHDLEKLIDLIESIDCMVLDFTSDVIEFITKVNNQGGNRYRTYYQESDEKMLFMLDKSVWQIRRYSYYLNSEVHGYKLFEDNLNNIHLKLKIKNKNEHTIVGGHLEWILKARKKPQIEILEWNNLYFGRKNQKTVEYTCYLTDIPSVTDGITEEQKNILKEYMKI